MPLPRERLLQPANASLNRGVAPKGREEHISESETTSNSDTNPPDINYSMTPF